MLLEFVRSQEACLAARSGVVDGPGRVSAKMIQHDWTALAVFLHTWPVSSAEKFSTFEKLGLQDSGQ